MRKLLSVLAAAVVLATASFVGQGAKPVSAGSLSNCLSLIDGYYHCYSQWWNTYGVSDIGLQATLWNPTTMHAGPGSSGLNEAAWLDIGTTSASDSLEMGICTSYLSSGVPCPNNTRTLYIAINGVPKWWSGQHLSPGTPINVEIYRDRGNPNLWHFYSIGSDQTTWQFDKDFTSAYTSSIIGRPSEIVGNEEIVQPGGTMDAYDSSNSYITPLFLNTADRLWYGFDYGGPTYTRVMNPCPQSTNGCLVGSHVNPSWDTYASATT